ncbi:MAG: hypothetical protein BGO25_03790 [Acidobacteriales bacterium 59-55]|nr:MAG: hypothetical protein BGO25_03790 [Acidobacteriales bacterium 59-55]
MHLCAHSNAFAFFCQIYQVCDEISDNIQDANGVNFIFERIEARYRSREWYPPDMLKFRPSDV